MCYDVRALTFKRGVYTNRFGVEFKDPRSADANIQNYHALGYDHPYLPVISTNDPATIDFFQWGLIPHWVNDPKKVVAIQNSTLNARGEELMEKLSYRDAFQYGHRCLILLDGFFEHHHKNGKIYPYYIALKTGEPFAVGGLWSYWKSIPGHERDTCTLITTQGNSLLAQIHNNPQLDGPRMPFIVPKELETTWLKEGLDPAEARLMISSFTHEELVAYPVRRLRGKEAVGNNPKAIEKFNYPELSFQQGSLF
jgi:putative SOS response-associated peptidase YedK